MAQCSGARRGCEQAIIPFSVRSASARAEVTQDGRAQRINDDAEVGSVQQEGIVSPFLSLRQGERVRVLRRETQKEVSAPTGTAPSTSSSVEDASLPPPLWCIAQREDGAVGLVPASLLYRAPGPPFHLRCHTTTPSAVATYVDPLEDLSGRKDAGGSTTAHNSAALTGDDNAATCRGSVLPSDGEGFHSGRRRSTEEEEAFRLQRRRQATLSDRLAPFHYSSRGSAASTHTVEAVEDGRDSGCEDSYPDSDEQILLCRENREMQAELHWLTEVMLPRLTVAREATQQETQAQRSSIHAKLDSCGDGPATSAFRQSLASVEVQSKYIEQLQVTAKALQAELQQVAQDADSSDDVDQASRAATHAPLSSLDDVLPVPASSIKTASDTLCTRDVNATPLLETAKPTAVPPVQSTRLVQKLRDLVKEELDTLRSYQLQRRMLLHRRYELGQLMKELSAEELLLAESETALHRLLDGVSVEQEVGFRWPRTLEGLTEEETAALNVSLRLYDKYTSKLRCMTEDEGEEDVTVGAQSAATALLSTRSPTTTEANHIQLVSERGAPTADRLPHPQPNIPTTNRKGPVAMKALAAQVEHLQALKEKGDQALVQLQAKVNAAQTFCDTYGPVAAEIQEQLQRGECVLAEKMKYLQKLQKATGTDVRTQ